MADKDFSPVGLDDISPVGLDDEEQGRGAEETKSEKDEPKSEVSDSSRQLALMSPAEKMKMSLKNNRSASDNHPAHFLESDDEEEGEEETALLGEKPKWQPSSEKNKSSLTSFIIQEAQMRQSKDPRLEKLQADLESTSNFKELLKCGFTIKTIQTKYLVPKSGLKEMLQDPTLTITEKREKLEGKTYTKEVKRVLYLLKDEETINFRGPLNEKEGFASPFMQTRESVTSYILSHMYKPRCSVVKRFIRLTFKCPPEAKVMYKTRHIDIFAANDDEFEILDRGFHLLWKYHSTLLKRIERDPKLLMRKSVYRPKTMEEKWDQIGYKPFVLQSLDPDNNIKNLYIGFGCSLEDLFLIGSSMSAFWCLSLLLYSILLKHTMESDENQFYLWGYFYFLLAVVGIVVIGTILEATDVQSLGLNASEVIEDTRGRRVPVEKEETRLSPREMSIVFMDKLYLWTNFFVVEVVFGAVATLLWMIFYDLTGYPLYRFYQSGCGYQEYHRVKKSSLGAAYSAKMALKAARARGHKNLQGVKSVPFEMAKKTQRVARKVLKTKGDAKDLTLSKRQIRKRQTAHIGAKSLAGRIGRSGPSTRSSESGSKRKQLPRPSGGTGMD